MDTQANRPLMLDHRTVAVFAGIDVIPCGDPTLDDFVLEVSILAVGRNGWREIVEHKRFERPFTTECNDAVCSYLNLSRMYRKGSAIHSVLKVAVDIGFIRDEAMALCNYARSKKIDMVPVRGSSDHKVGPLVHQRTREWGPTETFIRRNALRESLQAAMSSDIVGIGIADSDVLAYVAEILEREASPGIDKALGYDEVTKDISRTGDVTIILTSPDGEKRVVSVEDYNADIIADYLKSGTVSERLAKAQLALAEAKLLMQVPERVRRLLSAQRRRIDEITEAEAAKLVDDRGKRRSEAIESALQHLHRTDAAIRNRVSEMLWAQNIAT